MGKIPTNGIPPLAGLATYEEAAKPGLGVDDNVDLLRRYNYVVKRLYFISAAFMNPTPEWEVKSALSLHMYLDGEHGQSLRSRVAELRRPPLYLDHTPDERLEAFLDEAERAQNTPEFLTGIYRVVRPALLQAFKDHVASINPLFDYPTCRLLKTAIAEEDQMIEWGRQAIAAVVKTDQGRQTATAWANHLDAYLQAAGGISGKEEAPAQELPEKRA
ncbi:MAG: hypothetical protein ACAH95_06955, partial [Fimbriimonas sp.]